MANKEEELEDVRAAAQKKVKALEQQLENEHEERINFVREKHELETRIINLQEMASRSADEEQVSKLKRDLKRTKALLKDAQLMVEKSRNESSNKVVLRQLKNQVRKSSLKMASHYSILSNNVCKVKIFCLKDDVLPEMLSSLKCSLPKANGYYHPLAISFPSY